MVLKASLSGTCSLRLFIRPQTLSNDKELREGCRAYLCSDVIKNGQQHRIKDPGPERRCEGRAMILQRVKQHLHQPST